MLDNDRHGRNRDRLVGDAQRKENWEEILRAWGSLPQMRPARPELIGSRAGCLELPPSNPVPRDDLSPPTCPAVAAAGQHVDETSVNLQVSASLKHRGAQGLRPHHPSCSADPRSCQAAWQGSLHSPQPQRETARNSLESSFPPNVSGTPGTPRWKPTFPQ